MIDRSRLSQRVMVAERGVLTRTLGWKCGAKIEPKIGASCTGGVVVTGTERMPCKWRTERMEGLIRLDGRCAPSKAKVGGKCDRGCAPSSRCDRRGRCSRTGRAEECGESLQWMGKLWRVPFKASGGLCAAM